MNKENPDQGDCDLQPMQKEYIDIVASPTPHFQDDFSFDTIKKGSNQNGLSLFSHVLFLFFCVFSLIFSECLSRFSIQLCLHALRNLLTA
jgi:hypothetical protein